MTAVNGKWVGVGAWHAKAFALDASGRPTGASAGTTPYAGTQIAGFKSLDLTIPSPRIVEAFGDETIVGRFMLPPNQGIGMNMKSAVGDHAVREIISGVKALTAGEASGTRFGTNLDGYEPQVGLHFWQKAVDATGVNAGARYRSIFVPTCTIMEQPAGMNSDNASEIGYVINPTPVTQELWGITLVIGTDGCTSFQISQWITRYVPHVCQWLSASSSPAKGAFPTAYPAASTSKINAYTINGADSLSAATKAVDGITPASIASSDVMVAFYESLN